MRLGASFACARKVLRPSPPCFARSLPPRGSREEADNFMQIRGEAVKRLTIFAEENFVRKILCEKKELCTLRLHLRAPVKCCAPHHRRYAAEQAAEASVKRKFGKKNPPRGSL